MTDNFSGYKKTSISITGIPELQEALKKALLKHKPNDVRKALRRGSMVIVNEAKHRAPISKKPHTFETARGEKIVIQPGNLRRSIQILPKWSKDTFGLWVGPKVARRNAAKASVNAYYAHWVEYGTAAHNLGYKGKYVSGKGNDHRGSDPKPYMRPAYDSKANEAIRIAMEDIEKMIFSK